MTDSHRRSIRMPLLACCVFAAASLATGPPARGAEGNDGNVVSEWNDIAQNAIVTMAMQPIQRSQLWMTLVHVAIYDAVASITDEYEPFKVLPDRRRPASAAAAAVAAAHAVLVRLLPSQQPVFDAARARSLAAIRDGTGAYNEAPNASRGTSTVTRRSGPRGRSSPCSANTLPRTVVMRASEPAPARSCE